MSCAPRSRTHCGSALTRASTRSRSPSRVAGASITVYGGFFTLSLYMPHLWMVVLFQFLANAAVAPLSISIFQTLAATAPAEMRGICFGMFGVYSLVFGGFAGAVLLGAISDATHSVTTALTLIGPVCLVGGVLLAIGSRYVRHDITLVIEDVLERRFPVLRLVDTFAVSRGKFRFSLASKKGEGQLSHGVHCLGERPNEGLNMCR